MAVLKRLDFIVKKSSKNDASTQLQKVVDELNKRQELEANKEGSEYLIYYFGSLFDPRNSKTYYLFSDKFKDKFEIGASYIDTSLNDEIKKIKQALEKNPSSTGGNFSIDDNEISLAKSYSSQKIDELFVKKADFDTLKADFDTLKAKLKNEEVDIDFLGGL